MKVLIDVPDEIYKKIQDLNVDESLMLEPYKWIKNGEPIKKEFYSFVDADWLIEHAETCIETTDAFINLIRKAPRLIECKIELR
jgi:hypothetical protein